MHLISQRANSLTFFITMRYRTDRGPIFPSFPCVTDLMIQSLRGSLGTRLLSVPSTDAGKTMTTICWDVRAKQQTQMCCSFQYLEKRVHVKQKRQTLFHSHNSVHAGQPSLIIMTGILATDPKFTKDHISKCLQGYVALLPNLKQTCATSTLPRS